MNKFLGQVSYLPFFDQDTGGAGGAGGQQPAQGEKTEESPKWAKDLSQAVGQLTTGITELLNIGKARQQQPESEEEEEETSSGGGEFQELSDKELETLSRGEYARYMQQRIIKALQTDVVKPLGDAVTSTQQTVIAERTAREVGELMSKHADYWEWKDEMLELARENPTLSASRLYNLAKAENPVKTEELKKKYAKDEEESSEGGNTRNGTRQARNGKSFGGLPPRGGGGQTPNRKMSPVEASIAAWDAVVTELGRPDFLNEE